MRKALQRASLIGATTITPGDFDEPLAEFVKPMFLRCPRA